ncbi:hypothetical protein A5893_09595 [Pedobacter psychrophilus]|uniref:Uncharacterized protein n=1 Tax=Pedobacter psychrophilus TaxID=1826909 RepID=A0A179DH50_9SPHI|nr:hypothetical protein [Pedobacter psychrophilus]OAQ39819.1 hypothetical protein A5893_09595 [Pedobacter psychrophilus]
MTTIKNVQPLSAEDLYDLLKKEFAAYADSKMDSGLSIEYAHVHDIINVSFPEVLEGNAFTIIVSDDELTLERNEENVDYDTELLEGYLVDFLKEKCE